MYRSKSLKQIKIYFRSIRLIIGQIADETTKKSRPYFDPYFLLMLSFLLHLKFWPKSFRGLHPHRGETLLASLPTTFESEVTNVSSIRNIKVK